MDEFNKQIDLLVNDYQVAKYVAEHTIEELDRKCYIEASTLINEWSRLNEKIRKIGKVNDNNLPAEYVNELIRLIARANINQELIAMLAKKTKDAIIYSEQWMMFMAEIDITRAYFARATMTLLVSTQMHRQKQDKIRELAKAIEEYQNNKEPEGE